MKKINLKITTPTGVAYAAEPVSVTVDTKDGQVTILPGHVPLLSAIAAGEVMIRTEEKEEISFAVHGGFLEVSKGSVVTILADGAESSDEIDESAVEEAIARAQELKEKELDKNSQEYARISALLERDLAKLRVLRRRR